MSTTPNTPNNSPASIHADMVHRELAKELRKVTETFYETDSFSVDEEGKSVVISYETGFQNGDSRRLSVGFEEAVAHIAFDAFSRGLKTTFGKVQDLNTASLNVGESVKAVIDEMGKMDTFFRCHMRGHYRAQQQSTRPSSIASLG